MIYEDRLNYINKRVQGNYANLHKCAAKSHLHNAHPTNIAENLSNLTVMPFDVNNCSAT